MDVKEFFGDKAYFRKDILDTLKENSVDIYIPVNASSYRVNEELYSYNKNSDQWFCIAGNETINKKAITKKEEKIIKYIGITSIEKNAETVHIVQNVLANHPELERCLR